MASPKKTAKELAAQASREEQVLLSSTNRQKIESLLTAWVDVANVALSEIKSETTVSIVNAGDQLQKHPAVTVLEAASKRIEALVVLVERVADDAEGDGDDLPDDAPEAWGPRAVGD